MDQDRVLKLLREAQIRMKRGERRAARRLAERAASIAPNREEPWLVLAALATPRGSVAYLQQALQINPESERARQGMLWAKERLAAVPVTARPAAPKPPRPHVAYPETPEALVRNRPAWLPISLALVTLLIVLWLGFGKPGNLTALAQDRQSAPALANLFKPTYTPTPTATFTPTPTFTPSPSPTVTPSPTPTDTPTVTPTATLASGASLPAEVSGNERWIEVDLTNQRVYAYEGTTLQRAFTVSTGTHRTPTVLGSYRVYVKYRFADMAGPGYYLADVPYVMYFYRGYGLHGTYWHNNFGTPMSHGCVNLTIDDAGWLFDFASVGTLVHVHY